jgi:methylated-DNA-[protein]-cysteine S-methyltransferase
MGKQDAIKLLKGHDLTDFERKVLIATSSIQKGKVKTYKRIAEEIGHPNACRAVGTALKNNPLPVTIPCHRVIRSDGDIGGYALGRKKKAALLKKEGRSPTRSLP